MKRIIFGLLLISAGLFGQIKVKDLPTTTTGSTGDFLLKDDVAGIPGSTKKISVANFITTYIPTPWSLTGNSGTTPGTNFIGNTDDKNLMFKINNQQSGLIDDVVGATLFGYQTGLNITTADRSTAVGYQALKATTTGRFNTAMGFFSLTNNTTGRNTAYGHESAQQNTTGTFNTAIGDVALANNVTGSNNTAVGLAAMQAVGSNVNYNTSVGAFSLIKTTAGNNTMMGFDAGVNVTSGAGNTAVGSDAFQINTSGSNNTCIGDSADVGSATLVNATAIGHKAVVNASNSIQLGNASVTDLAIGTGSLTTTATAPNLYYDNATGSVKRSTASIGSGTVTSVATASGITGGTITTTGTLKADTGLLATHYYVNNTDSVGTITRGTWSGTTIATTKGGTGLTSYTTGDLIQATASNTLSALSSVSAGSYLRSAGTTTANVWSTLKLPNSATANYIPYATSTNTWGESSSLTFDGTTFTTPISINSTSVTTPKVIGGTGTTSTLTLQSTSGVGTTNADIIFKTGNNGATEVARMLNGGNVGVGTSAPNCRLHVVDATDNVTVFKTVGASSTTSSWSSANPVAEFANTNASTNNWALFQFSDNSSSFGSTFFAAKFTDRTNHYGDLYFASKQSDGFFTRLGIVGANVGIASTAKVAWGTASGTGISITPTAYFHLPAGTTTVAPLKFTSGTNLTTAEAGAKEYNGTHYETKASALRYALGGIIADFTSDANNTSTTETDLYSYTTPASTLANTGEKIIAKYGGTNNDATATTEIKVLFAGTTIFDSGAITLTGTGSWAVEVMIIRTGASTARSIVNMNTGGASTAVYTTETDLTGLTFTNTNILKITGTAGGGTGGSNDITAKLGTIFWHGLAAN